MFQQAVEHEGGFPQPAWDRLLVEPQAVVGGLSIERHAPALEHVAVVGRQQVDGHIETHPVGRAARPAAVHPAQGQTAGVIDEIDTGGFERVRLEMAATSHSGSPRFDETLKR